MYIINDALQNYSLVTSFLNKLELICPHTVKCFQAFQ